MENIKNMESKQIIIIGGGSSIKKGVQLGLWDKLKDCFVLGTNYSFRDYTPTALIACDNKFHSGQQTEHTQTREEWRKELAQLPLIIAPNKDEINNTKLPNTITIPYTVQTYCGLNSKEKGFYSIFLTGLFSISIAIYLLQEKGTIILLGYDWSQRTYDQQQEQKLIDTHYYNHTLHPGIQKSKVYEEYPANDWFQPFLKATSVKIYNASIDSHITCFERINYPKLFSLLEPQSQSQDELRNYIKERLC